MIGSIFKYSLISPPVARECFWLYPNSDAFKNPKFAVSQFSLFLAVPQRFTKLVTDEALLKQH